MKNYKYVIVGQGIAGTLIAMECLIRNIPFKVIDLPTLSRASRIAAGIINPITGRKFVKTWMYEALEQAFLESYSAFEDLLGNKYLHDRDIIRAIHKVADQNNWDAKSLSIEASSYMDAEVNLNDFESRIHKKYGYGAVKGYQLNMAQLLSDFREYLNKLHIVQEEEFDFMKLDVSPREIRYGEVKAESIIFCEGHKAMQNPYFKHLPFAPAKGELLIVKIPSLETKMLLKDKIFICPIEADLFWVGATYAWDDLTDIPTEEKKEWLLNALETAISIPYEVVNHLAGVRPATDNRRPFIGRHSTHINFYIFNGLGTKGASLGPYWAKHFMNYLEDGENLDGAVNISNIL